MKFGVRATGDYWKFQIGSDRPRLACAWTREGAVRCGRRRRILWWAGCEKSARPVRWEGCGNGVHCTTAPHPDATDLHVRENCASLDITLTAEDLTELDQAFPPPCRETPLEMK